MVSKEDTEQPKKYYQIATMSTGLLFMINGFMMYFSGENKIKIHEIYGFNNDESHLQRSVAVLFFVMGVINLAPNLFGREGFSLKTAAEYYPLLIALLNVVVSCHYIIENFRYNGMINWVSFFGLIIFILLNLKLASLSHPGQKLRRNKVQ